MRKTTTIQKQEDQRQPLPSLYWILYHVSISLMHQQHKIIIENKRQAAFLIFSRWYKLKVLYDEEWRE